MSNQYYTFKYQIFKIVFTILNIMLLLDNNINNNNNNIIYSIFT